MDAQRARHARPGSIRCGRSHMRVRSIRRCALLVPLAWATGGCSLLFVHGPPPGYEAMDSFPCTESKVLPRLDYAGAIVALLVAAVVAPTSGESELFGLPVTTSSGSGTNAAFALGGAALLGVSGWMGGRRVEDCRAARPPALRPPPQSPAGPHVPLPDPGPTASARR